MRTIDLLIRANPKESKELSKAFFLAIIFHLSFLFFFHGSSQKPCEHTFPLPFTSVEVDLGEEVRCLLPSSNEIVLIFPEENPMTSLFSLNTHDKKRWMKRDQSDLSNPDFSSFESIPYFSSILDQEKL